MPRGAAATRGERSPGRHRRFELVPAPSLRAYHLRPSRRRQPCAGSRNYGDATAAAHRDRQDRCAPNIPARISRGGDYGIGETSDGRCGAANYGGDPPNSLLAWRLRDVEALSIFAGVGLQPFCLTSRRPTDEISWRWLTPPGGLETGWVWKTSASPRQSAYKSR